MDMPAQPGTGLQITSANAPSVSVGGILTLRPISQIQAEERQQAAQANARPYITGIAGHLRTRWDEARTAKMQTIEPRLLQCLRQRRGEYDPEKLAAIKAQGGSDIYMMLSSNKARAAASWIKDVMMGSGSEKPWSIDPTAVPSLPESRKTELFQELQGELATLLQTGIQLTPLQMRELVAARKEMALNELRDQAKSSARAMESKMEDQLQEGGFVEAFSQFIDDYCTFPAAFMKGPVIRRRQTLAWQGDQMVVTEELRKEWERVDPFMIYNAPYATSVDDGYLIERHRLSRSELESFKGVDGYSDKAIDAVLAEYGRGGLHEWLWIDSAKAVAEGKSLSAVMNNSDGLIDALQYMGSVQGQMLLDWGMDEVEDDLDPLKEYEVEAWLIGSWVIKAMVNPDPLKRRGYYKASYEEVPGAFWGNSPMDLIRDCQDVCNASARALVSNMGIASGPQVWINVDRLPRGEQITQIFPWKIHQVTADPLGGTAPPMGFFQPSSLAGELMAVYEKFSVLADEYSGVPRYMTGDSPAGGAGRTATGMSMLMNNAGKSIKQVISNIDRFVLKPLLERQWYYNMRYEDDPDLKGDIRIVVRGATSLIVKDAAAQRRNEFLQMALTNPVAYQALGPEPIVALLHEQAKTLDMNADKIMPAPEVVQARQLLQQAMQVMQQQAAQQGPDESYDIQRDANGQMTGMSMRKQRPVSNPNQNLGNGAPVADHFSPMRSA